MSLLLALVLSPEGYIELAGILLGGIGVGSVATLLARGLWVKHGAPEVVASIVAWYGQPEQLGRRQAEIKAVVENEIRRDDGLIAQEITNAIDAIEKRVDARFFDVERDVESDREFRENTIGDLAKIKSALNLLTRGSIDSAPAFAAVHTPRPTTKPLKGPGDSGGWKKPVK